MIMLKGLTLFSITQLIFIFAANAQSVQYVKTEIKFNDVTLNKYRTLPNATELFLNEGLLISSFEGTPIITKDNVVTQKFGICSNAKREVTTFGVTVLGNVCADVYLGFVSSRQKMIIKFAKNIKIIVIGLGGVKATWFDEGLNQKSELAKVKSDGTMEFLIPDKTEGVLLFSENQNCGLCNFMVTELSYDLISSPYDISDSICGSEYDTDASISHRKLINEDYSSEVYKKLDSFAVKGSKELPVLIQNLTPKKITRDPKTTYIDEFAIVVKLPNDEGELIKEIFKSMRTRLDTVGIGKAAETFKSIGTFSYLEPDLIKTREKKLPTVTDIFQVDIMPSDLRGIDNGDVMMTELVEYLPTAASFRYTTLTNNLKTPRIEGNKRHPNNGSRKYGFFTTLNGWTKFYVRGIDQFDFEVPLIKGWGLLKQEEFWLSFLEGIGERVKANGGSIVFPATKTIDEKITQIPKCYKPPKAGYSAN